MIVICYGMPKSASTFTFQLSTDIAYIHDDQWQLNKKLPEELQSTFIAENLSQVISKIHKYIKNDQLYVIKTHCPLNDTLVKMIQEGNVKAIVSIRDPYDIVVSLKDAGDNERQKELSKQRQYFAEIKSYEDALKLIPAILKDASSWLKYSGSGKLDIPFYKIAREPLLAAREIARHIGVDADVSNIVDSYISNKQSIIEFNVGEIGRGKQLFLLAETNQIKKDMDKFIETYF